MCNFEEKIKWEIIVILNVPIYIIIISYYYTYIYHINIITISLYDLMKNEYHSWYNIFMIYSNKNSSNSLDFRLTSSL